MPTTINGNIKDLAGVANTSGVGVRLALKWSGNGTPRVSGTLLASHGPSLGERLVYPLTVNPTTGAISGSVYSTRDAAGTGNGEIDVGGSLLATWYEVQVLKNGVEAFTFPVHAKNGATLDLSTVTPITVSPVVPAPTGDSVYARLDGGNQPFTGVINFLQGIVLAIAKSVAWSTDLFLGRASAGKLTVGSTAGATDGTVAAASLTNLTGQVTPNAAGGIDLGTAALPFAGIRVGAAPTNNIRVTGTATGARTVTIPDTTDTFIMQVLGQSIFNKVLFGTGVSNSVNLVDSQDTLGNLTGTGAAQTVYTKTIPANTVVAGKGIRIKYHAINNNNAGVTYAVVLGTTTLFTSAASSAVATTQHDMTIEIWNNAGVQNAQRATWLFADGGGFTANTTGTSAENFANALAVKITASEANPNTITPIKWSIELIQ